ncbi:hypothetical protein ABIC16_001576 [Sphingomonas sp. PvP055]|uniref:hypothetical protein n=1 Tax=Sphingomonas sp. PvP055 TaxID=3156391 RepID=UPI00339196E7
MIRSTFAVPTLIALATVFGLVAALTGEGWRDAAAWIALAIPVAAVGWAMARAGHPSSTPRPVRSVARARVIPSFVAMPLTQVPAE